MLKKQPKKAGRGQKSCVSCGEIIGARSFKCKKCGASQQNEAERFWAKSISSLTVDECRLFLSLIDQIKSEKTPEKPQKPKPTVEDFAAAIGEPAKSSDLKALLEQWKAFESRAEVPEKLIKRIREAMKG